MWIFAICLFNFFLLGGIFCLFKIVTDNQEQVIFAVLEKVDDLEKELQVMRDDGK